MIDFDWQAVCAFGLGAAAAWVVDIGVALFGPRRRRSDAAPRSQAFCGNCGRQLDDDSVALGFGCAACGANAWRLTPGDSIE